MKQKNLFMFAAAALAFAACTSEEVTPQQDGATQGEVPVLFDTYVNRTTTRAGYTGEVNIADLKADGALKDAGFGVFSYYTDGVPYSETSTPNFMYNQQVKWDGSAFSYNPVKYWPNEFGANAESEGKDKLTFFAYAPYVTVIPGTGRINTTVHDADNALSSGIVGMTSNVATGDPYVKYYVDFDPDNRVDLCWGVAAADYTSSVVADLNSYTAGDTYIDMSKPELNSSSTTGKIKFNFLHALASLNVQIDADVDIAPNTASHADNPNKNTRIWVRSVTFEGFTDKGSLNLNAKASEGPLWYELSSTNTQIGSGLVTIFDGRRDGKEPQPNATAANEKTLGLNPQLIQSIAYQNPYNSSNGLMTNSATIIGVRKDAVNLFAANGGADADANLAMPIYVIPTGEDLKITIVYDVETYDPNVSGFLADGITKGISVENKITKTIKKDAAAIQMVAGNAYTVKLHLGLTSVQFDADVKPWVSVAADPTDLPFNTTH